MSDRVEEHGTPSIYERTDYVNIVEDDDDEFSDEESMTPQHTDDEDELFQAQLSSGGRQNVERFPPRGPQIPTQATARKDAPTKTTAQPVVRGDTKHPTRVPNPNKYATSSQNASSSSSKNKKSNGGK